MRKKRGLRDKIPARELQIDQKPAGADPLLHDFFELGGRLPLLIHAVFLRVNFGSTGLVGQAKHRLNG